MKGSPVMLRFFQVSLLLCFLMAALPLYAQRGGDIKAVDFKNFTYRPGCAYDGKPVRARGGKFERPSEDDRMYFSVRQVTYGDLTGDGRAEAVVVSHCNTGGTGQFTEGYVYTMRRGRAVEILRLEQGDRAFGGIKDVRIEHGLLLVERYAPAEPGVGACCPKYIDTDTYRVRGSRLVAVGRTKRRDAPEQQ